MNRRNALELAAAAADRAAALAEEAERLARHDVGKLEGRRRG